MHDKTKIQLNKIKDMHSWGYTLDEIGFQLDVTKQAISYLICRYIPELRKEFHKRPTKDFKRLSDLEVAQHARYHRKRQNAKNTGYEFTIKLEEINWPEYCPILGLKLDYFAEYRKEESASFDRINPNLGYVSGNVIIVSWRANRIKNDGSAEEHRKIAEFLDTYKIPVDNSC